MKKEHRFVTRKEAADMLGVSMQTISNWIEEGILSGKKIKNGNSRWNLYIDGNTIKALFDDLTGVEQAKARLAAQKEEIMRLNRELDKEIDDIKDNIGIMHNPALANATRKMIYSLIVALGDEMMTDTEKMIVKMMMSECENVDTISDYFGISQKQVVRTVLKAAYRLRFVAKIPHLRQEIVNLNKEIARLRYDNMRLAAGVQLEKLNEKQIDAMTMKLEDCGLSVRAMNICKAADLHTLHDLSVLQPRSLLRYRNCGTKTIKELEELLIHYNL